MNELHDLLELSTDLVDGPDLAARALVGARRRRTTHRAVVASVAVAAVVAGVALAGSLGDRDGDTDVPIAPPSSVVIQGPFDPADVDKLPAAGDDVAPVLPDEIELPRVAPRLADEPMDAAVLAFFGEDGVSLLGAEGDWRSVPIDGIYGGAELSADGTRLAVTTETGADVWDLPTGERTRLDRPVDFPVTDENYGWWRWVDDQTLMLDDGREDEGGWLVDTESGDATPVAYPTSLVNTVDPGGALVEVPEADRLSGIKADGEHVVGVQDRSVVVADRDDLTPRTLLRFVDPDGNFTRRQDAGRRDPRGRHRAAPGPCYEQRLQLAAGRLGHGVGRRQPRLPDGGVGARVVRRGTARLDADSSAVQQALAAAGCLTNRCFGGA